MKALQDPHLEIPHGNAAVWRYMAQWKLEKLLQDRALFFPNASRLSDQYEVSIPASTLMAKRDELAASGLQGQSLEAALAAFHWECNPLKEQVLVNCWSLSAHESYALWKIYLGGERNGVAIRSTVSSLRRALLQGGDDYPQDFYLAKVQYRRHLTVAQAERLAVITTKKPFYDFEKELRLFILDGEDNHPSGRHAPFDASQGRNVRIDLPLLIQQVYVSPFADPGYAEQVSQRLHEAGLNPLLLRQSEIRDS